MKPQNYAWVVVGLLWFTAVLNYVDRQVMFSVFPLVQADLQLSSVQLGLLSSVFLWVYGVLSPFSGYLGDRLGRKAVIVPSLLVWSLVTWGTGHARNYSELFVARGLMGISEACYLPAALAMIADYHANRTRSLATAVHQTGIYAGLVLGGIAGGWLGERYGWRLAFTILGMIGVAYTLVVTRSLKEAGSNPSIPVTLARPRLRSSLRELMSLSGYMSLLVVFCALGIANWLVFTWLPLYLYERFRMGLAIAGFSSTFYVQAACVIGAVVGGRLADQWCRGNPRGRILTQVIGLSGAAPCLFLVGYTAYPLLLIGGLVVFGFAKGLYECNVMPVLCQVARRDLRATGFGVFNFAGCITAGFTSMAAGALKPLIGLGGSMQVAGILLCLSAILLFRVRVSFNLESSCNSGALK